MLIRRILPLCLTVVLLVGLLPRAEAGLYCRTTERRVPECCCEPAASPCASEGARSSCACCEVQYSDGDTAQGAAPLVPKASYDRPDRVDAGPLGASSLGDFLPAVARFKSSAAAAPVSRSVPSLYILHRVLLC